MKTKPNKINIPLLRKIQRAITKEPLRVDMLMSLTHDKSDLACLRQMPKCGTVGCIAGWAVVYSGQDKKNLWLGSVLRIGQKVLWLDHSQAQRLFWPSNWPQKFMDELDKFKDGTSDYARVVCARIGHFIKTSGE